MQHGTSPAPTGRRRSLTPLHLEASLVNIALLELLGREHLESLKTANQVLKGTTKLQLIMNSCYMEITRMITEHQSFDYV